MCHLDPRCTVKEAILDGKVSYKDAANFTRPQLQMYCELMVEVTKEWGRQYLARWRKVEKESPG
jgi:hypothetical protein